MLLVVLRQKAQNEGATGEYKRGAKSPKVHSLKQDGIAWQAWVSDQARTCFALFCMMSDDGTDDSCSDVS